MTRKSRNIEQLQARADWYANGCDGLEDLEGYKRRGLMEDAATDLQNTLDLLALATEAIARVSALVEQAEMMSTCTHAHHGGGNDYLLCDDCGLSWDYRREECVDGLVRYLIEALAQALHVEGASQ